MALITEQNNISIFKTKFSTGGGFIVTLLGLAILALAERVLYDTGRLLVGPPLDYFNNINVIGIHTVVIILFLAIALGANLFLGERKQRYALALIPYYVVSIILALQLVMQVSIYFVNHHTTLEFYVLMLAIVIASTLGMYFAQKRFVPTSGEMSGPSSRSVIAVIVVFFLIFWAVYAISGGPRLYNDGYSSDYYQQQQIQQEMRDRQIYEQQKRAMDSQKDISYVSQPGAYDIDIQGTVKNGLIGHWNLTDGEGMGTAIDSANPMGSGGYINTKPLPVVNTTGNQVVKSVTYFKGVMGSHVQIPNSGNITFLNGSNITLSAWIRPRELTGLNTILNKDMTSVNPPTTNYALRAGQGPGKEKRLEFYYADQNGRWQEYVSNNDVLITDKWQHVSASYTFNNAGTAKLYVNGEVVPGTWVNGSGYESPSNIGGVLWIGALNDEYSDQSFKGLIADVRLYNRIVTPQEIKQLFSSVRLPEGTYR